ncbi:putative F-box-like domain superfamily protein [Helianthus annuus]|nr:putative F-box-like domain superfamily protein [Helianthus annuus]
MATTLTDLHPPITIATTLTDLHPDIIHTHILPRLDGPSLSATATASSSLKSLCSDDTLWFPISQSTFPSTTHPHVNSVISTFPSGHRSFFLDSFPTITTDLTHRNPRRSWSHTKYDHPSCNLHPSSHSSPSQLISTVDICYQNDVIFSKPMFTDITSHFLSSGFLTELSEDNPTRTRLDPTRIQNDPTRIRPGAGTGSDPFRIARPIDLTVDEIAGADAATLRHLKESVKLNWIIIDPTRKRACNLSSIKAVSARQDWVTNESIIRYATVLPGCDPDEIVRCRIQVVLGVGEKGVGLYVKEVVMKVQDMDGVCVNGVEFLKIVEGVMMEVNGVRRKVGDDEERLRCCRVFKELKREKKEWEKMKEEKKEMVIWLNYVAIFVSFCFCVYFLLLLLKNCKT